MLNPVSILSGRKHVASRFVRVSVRQKIALCAVCSLLLWFSSPSLSARDYTSLRKQLHRVIAECKAEVGIAVIINGKDTLTLNNDGHYPMMSVYKFHQALAVAHCLEQQAIPLDSMIYVKKEDLRPDTYSPFRDRYPEGNAWFSVEELLTYTLQWSDNNVCDILFDCIINTGQTDALLRRMGMSDFNISATEHEMHNDINRCYDNWSTPLASAELLDAFVARRVVQGHYYDFILRTMLECTTGEHRLPAGLPQEVSVGHKTGTAPQGKNSICIGVNDIGFVFLPENRRYSIAVYVKNSQEDLAANEHVIAEISRTVYSFLTEL